MSLGKEFCYSPEGNVCSSNAAGTGTIADFFFFQKAIIKKLSLLVY